MKNPSIFPAFFSLSLLLFSLYAHAQTNDSTRTIIEDGWIEKMSNKIALDVSLNNTHETFEVKSSPNNIKLNQNIPNNLRFKLNYKFISFGFQFAPKFISGNGDEDLKGKTKSFGLGTTLIFKHWFLDVSYSQVKGFYLENTEDYIPWKKGDPYIQFPDLHYYGFALSSGYISNSRYSLRSLTSQTERQLKSAGSFIPVLNFRYYVVDDQSDAASTQISKNTEASLGPGYAYTFVLKEKFYLSLGALSSLGYLKTNATTRQATENFKTSQDNLLIRWEGRTGVGYNGNRFYTGVYGTVSGTQHKQENTTVLNRETKFFYHLFLGIRINSPELIEKQMNKVEGTFPKIIH